MQSEKEFLEYEQKRKQEYDNMHNKLSIFDDYEKYKHLLPPYIEKTYEDYKAEYEYYNNEKNKEDVKSEEAGVVERKED